MAFLLHHRPEAAEAQRLILSPIDAAVQAALTRRPLPARRGRR